MKILKWILSVFRKKKTLNLFPGGEFSFLSAGEERPHLVMNREEEKEWLKKQKEKFPFPPVIREIKGGKII